MKMLNGDYMAKISSRTVAVCDAGPIIHLDELDSLDLLSDFHLLIIPETVQKEIARYRPKIFQHDKIAFKAEDATYPPESRLLVLSKAFLLDKGELESLSLMQKNAGAILLTDDAAARLAGEELGYKVHGTIGMVLRAIRKKTRTPKDVLKLLNEIPERTTLFLRPALLKDIIQKVKDEYFIKI